MKEKISNKIELKDKRQRLRIALTPQELMLWSKLKKRNLGYKFRRQHSFGSYIADFYRREKSLIVEIDGSQHMDQERYDIKRTEFLESHGLRVVRFGNNEINTNVEGVMLRILELLEN